MLHVSAWPEARPLSDALETEAFLGHIRRAKADAVILDRNAHVELIDQVDRDINRLSLCVTARVGERFLHNTKDRCLHRLGESVVAERVTEVDSRDVCVTQHFSSHSPHPISRLLFFPPQS